MEGEREKPEFIVLFGGRKSEDFAENPLPRISMFTSLVGLWSYFPKSIYYIEENANVVGVGTDISFKICHGKKPASRQSIDSHE
jgi:hypothetical protein